MSSPGSIHPMAGSPAQQQFVRSYQSSSATAPAGPSTSSSSSTRNSKLDQIIQNFYTKTVQVIVQARLDLDSEKYGKRSSTSSTSSSRRGSAKERKLNKWFNIATQDVDFMREEIRYWRTQALQAVDEEPPPLILDIYLDTSELTRDHQILVLADDHLRLNRVDMLTESNYPVERILLERWTLRLSHPLPDFAVDLPNLYKRSIVFFRALYSFVRLLPAYELHRRLRKYGQSHNLCLGYRLSTSTYVPNDEIPLDRSLLESDDKDLKLYQFSDVLTPLGTFKLNVQYRKRCSFCVEDSERDLSARMIDLDEQFFTPTMIKHHQEQEAYSRPHSANFSYHTSTVNAPARSMESSTAGAASSDAAGSNATTREEEHSSMRYSPPHPLHPRQTTDKSSPHEILQQRQRHSSLAMRSPSTLSSPLGRDSPVTRTLQPSPVESITVPRRISAPHMSPFKSPSLSSSPQAEYLISGVRPQPSPSEKTRTTTETTGRSKVEFSPSFEKYRERSSPSRADTSSASMTRRWSRASDHSSINFMTESDDAELEEFMRFAAAKPELKMFQSRANASQMMESTNVSPTSETSSSLGTSGYGSGSIYRSKKALSHFRSLRETNNTLSESLSSSVMAAAGGERQDTTTSAIGTSLGSSTSSASRSYMPVVPSPLHTEHSSTSPVHIPRSHHRASESNVQPTRQHRRYHSSQAESRGAEEQSPDQTAFSSYPQDRHHDELRRLCSDNHRYSPPSSPRQGSSMETSANQANSAQGPRASSLDDDDSLVFKMSELGCESGSQQQQQQQQKQPVETADLLFQRPLTKEAYNTRDYARRLGLQVNVSSHHHMSGSLSVPQSATTTTAVSGEEEEEEKGASASTSKSDPVTTYHSSRHNRNDDVW